MRNQASWRRWLWTVGLIGACPQAMASEPGKGVAPAPPTPAATTDLSTAVVEHPENVLVRFVAGADPAGIEQAHRDAGVLEVLFKYTIVPGLQAVRVAPGQVHRAMDAYTKSGLALYAEPDYMHYAMGRAVRPSMLAQTLPYGIDMVHAPQAWSQGVRGAGVIVADLDTGVDLNHEDLPTPVAMQSFIAGEAVQDGNNHGTHTAGTILANDNGLGVVGVAPDADLMAGKVLSNAGSGATSGIVQGIQWAVANGAKVISMSLGGGGFDQSFADACLAAFNSGVVVVASAGNGNTATPSYPASYPGVICVAAIDSAMARASFSNFGPTIDITGPGVGVTSTIPATGALTPTASWNSTARTTIMLIGSATNSVSAQAVFCGTGGTAADFPAGVAGRIAHIRRGGTVPPSTATITFNTKATNAVNAGAIGVIISDDGRGLGSWTLNGNFGIPVVGVSQADGNDLQANDAIQASIQFSASTTSGYGSLSGTSMSCPHVSGVAALLWSAFPPGTLTPALIEQAMEQSAFDLGDPGRDDLFGFGLVRADAALAWLRTNLPAPCAADIAIAGTGAVGHDGQVTGEDFDLFVQAFFTLQRDAQNLLIADVAIDGTGAVGRDGFVTGADFDAFVQLYFTGCGS